MVITIKIGLKNPCMIEQKNIKLLEVWREEQSIESMLRRYIGEQFTRNDHGN